MTLVRFCHELMRRDLSISWLRLTTCNDFVRFLVRYMDIGYIVRVCLGLGCSRGVAATGIL